MAPVDSTLSARLASLFDKSTGKTQAALARYCGVSTSAVNQWTKSGKIFDSNLRKVAEFFGVSQRWLQTGEGRRLHKFCHTALAIKFLTDSSQFPNTDLNFQRVPAVSPPGN